MFDKLKNALLGRGAPVAPASGLSSQHSAFTPVSEWAAAQGFSFTGQADGQSFSLQGKVAGQPWRMEVGRPSRAYIQGEELRARAELGIDDVAVMVMSRGLKDSLESQAYERYTDSLQTSVDHNLPEEVRWLAMFEEFGWDGPPATFWERYAVLGDRRDNAVAWVDPVLANQLLTWPTAADLPFVLMVLRGKAYLRMQQRSGDMQTVQHAAQVFTAACQSAVSAFKSRA